MLMSKVLMLKPIVIGETNFDMCFKEKYTGLVFLYSATLNHILFPSQVFIFQILFSLFRFSVAVLRSKYGRIHRN